MPYSYGDIKETVKTKSYFPMNRNLMMVHEAMGWDYMEMALSETIQNFYDIVRLRLEESIQTSKLLLDGKLPNANNIFSYY